MSMFGSIMSKIFGVTETARPAEARTPTARRGGMPDGVGDRGSAIEGPPRGGPSSSSPRSGGARRIMSSRASSGARPSATSRPCGSRRTGG